MKTAKVNPSRILVVDDEQTVCDSIRMLLDFEGHTVRTASSAKEALEIFDATKIDVLITDYAMPGMPGAQLATAIRKLAPELPVILVTAYAEMLDSWGADLTDVDLVISKPFRLEDLRKALADIPSASRRE